MDVYRELPVLRHLSEMLVEVQAVWLISEMPQMKRLLVLALLCLLAMPVAATNYNFQNPGDITHVVAGGTNGAISWGESTIGGNNNITVTATNNPAYFALPANSTTFYAAATYLGASVVNPELYPYIVLFRSDGSILYSPAEARDIAPGSRVEVKVSGGVARVYDDGVVEHTSGALAENPSKVGFGTWITVGSWSTYWDDFVYGQDENKYVLGLPESDDDKFIILDDITNSANDGLFNTTSLTQTDANYMSGTWARGNETTPLTNESIQLISYPAGTVYATNYTSSAFAGNVTIDIKTLIIDAGAPDGQYALTIPGSGQYSNRITKRSLGADINFDKSQYSQQDTATMTYSVEGAYWDTGTYTYKVVLLDGTYFTAKQNSTISLQSGSVTYTFTEDDDQGVYYAIIMAIDSSGKEYWLDLDYAELDAYVTFTGYVMNETGMVLPNANVSMVQGATVSNSITPAAGNYTASGFFTGGLVQFNVTASGYNQYYAELIPLVAKTVDLNFTLVATNPSYTGLGIGGVARDGHLETNTITLGYGRPINNATVHLVNTSTAESYTKLTNIAGWYLCDEGTSCFLTNNRPYDVWGEKLGYDNSANYTVVASG